MSELEPSKHEQPYKRKLAHKHQPIVPEFSLDDIIRSPEQVKKTYETGFRWLLGEYEQEWLDGKAKERKIRARDIMLERKDHENSGLREKNSILQVEKEKDAVIYQREIDHLKEQGHSQSVASALSATLVFLGGIFATIGATFLSTGGYVLLTAGCIMGLVGIAILVFMRR